MTRQPTLYIRNVPAEVYERLAKRAEQNGRSIGAEALAIVTAAVHDEGEEEFE